MANKQPGPLIMFVGIAVAFAWLLFVGLWLFYYASDFSILQNIGIFFLSLAVVAILETVIWVPWAMKQPDWGSPPAKKQ
ncbi:MAG: hypothetical protein WBZ42_07605 [Halobacteriota archaeon]